MPTLDWIGKRAVANHHREIPYRLLHCDREASAGEPGGGNLLVEGDNLQALKALLPYYAGQVKCIYIDPPYNTGNEGWVYNDNVNAPEIQKWLGDTVGKEAEDLSRHDKWLCMMYPRVALLREFMRDDGVIFISVDDNEVAHLRLLMDEIFGSRNFIANFIWEKRKNRENRKTVSVRHDYVVAYAREAYQALSRFHLLPMDSKALARYKNLDNDPRGRWKSDPATAQAGHGTPSQFYVVTAPNGKIHHLPSGRCWVYTEDVMRTAIADGRIWFGKHGNNVPRIKTFLEGKERGLTPETILFAKDASTNEEAKNALKELFDGRALFETPKPVPLITQLLRMCTRDNDLVLDSFAGSGTTGHAVLALNKEDKGTRRFILCEMESKIAREITSERLIRAIRGYGKTPPLGGSFRYCTLGEPLFDAEGRLRQDVKWGDLAHHLWFAESGEPWMPQFAEAKQSLATGGPMIGVGPDGRAVYLLFSGPLPAAQRNGASTLSSETLDWLAPFDGPRVVYADACTLRASALSRERIAFKQIPYQVQQK